LGFEATQVLIDICGTTVFCFLLNSAEFYLHADFEIVFGIAENPSGIETQKSCNNNQTFLKINVNVTVCSKAIGWQAIFCSRPQRANSQIRGRGLIPLLQIRKFSS
jgi:hypothetical protein